MQKLKTFLKSTITVALALMIVVFVVKAGTLDPTTSDTDPQDNPTSTMHTLDDIYYKLATSGSATSYDLDSPASPTSTMHTLTEIYDKAPDFNSNPGSATTGDVCNSATFYSDSATQLTGSRSACFASSTDPGEANVFTGISYMIQGTSKTGSLTKACNATGSVSSSYASGQSDRYCIDNSEGGTLASAGDVLSGKGFWSGTGWSQGTMPTQTLSNTTTTLTAGYYNATSLDAVDTDLATANIKSGISLFGIDGDGNVVDTSDANATSGNILSGYSAYANGTKYPGAASCQSCASGTAAVSDILSGQTADIDCDGSAETGTYYPDVDLHTGQATCYDASGSATSCSSTIGQAQDASIDGTSKNFSTSTDGMAETVVDTDNGLMWQKDDQPSHTWYNAVKYCGNLALCNDGTWKGSSSTAADCSSNSGVKYGDWHLPTIAEGVLMADYSCDSGTPSHCNAAYQNNALTWDDCSSCGLWLSTTQADNTSLAYSLNTDTGGVYNYFKTDGYVVRCGRRQ